MLNVFKKKPTPSDVPEDAPEKVAPKRQTSKAAAPAKQRRASKPPRGRRSSSRINSARFWLSTRRPASPTGLPS